MRRHWQYFKYVVRHKWYVFWAALHHGVPIWIAFFHDWDKFLPDEWFPYARTFYRPNGEKQYVESDAFSIAWLKHQNRNKHHWQYWMITWDKGTTECLPIPDVFIREMVADWKGAGRALGKPDYQKWYTQNYHSIQIHPESRKRVDELLHVNFSDEELEQADMVAQLESWPIKSSQEAALHFRRSHQYKKSLGSVTEQELEIIMQGGSLPTMPPIVKWALLLFIVATFAALVYSLRMPHVAAQEVPSMEEFINSLYAIPALMPIAFTLPIVMYLTEVLKRLRARFLPAQEWLSPYVIACTLVFVSFGAYGFAEQYAYDNVFKEVAKVITQLIEVFGPYLLTALIGQAAVKVAHNRVRAIGVPGFDQ